MGEEEDAISSSEIALADGDGRDGSAFPAVPIVVDIKAIDDFAALLAQELDANFRPAQDRVVLQHSDGVGFGSRHASTDMRITVRKYYDCLSTAVDNLRAYVAASDILIGAAQKVAAAYRSADMNARTIQRTVDTALTDAVREAELAQQRAAEDARREAVLRRLAQYE